MLTPLESPVDVLFSIMVVGPDDCNFVRSLKLMNDLQWAEIIMTFAGSCVAYRDTPIELDFVLLALPSGEVNGKP